MNKDTHYHSNHLCGRSFFVILLAILYLIQLCWLCMSLYCTAFSSCEAALDVPDFRYNCSDVQHASWFIFSLLRLKKLLVQYEYGIRSSGVLNNIFKHWHLWSYCYLWYKYLITRCASQLVFAMYCILVSPPIFPRGASMSLPSISSPLVWLYTSVTFILLTLQ